MRHARLEARGVGRPLPVVTSRNAGLDRPTAINHAISAKIYGMMRTKQRYWRLRGDVDAMSSHGPRRPEVSNRLWRLELFNQPSLRFQYEEK